MTSDVVDNLGTCFHGFMVSYLVSALTFNLKIYAFFAEQIAIEFL